MSTMLPNELLVMIFESLSPGSLARCALCSKLFSQLAQPVLWRTVYAHRAPLALAKRIYSTLRTTPHLAASVHLIDVSGVLQPGGPVVQVLDELAILPLLPHLRALSLHGGHRARELLQYTGALAWLRALQMRVTKENAPFVASLPQLTALMHHHPGGGPGYDWATAQLLGAGVPLQAVSLSLAVLIRMLRAEAQAQEAEPQQPLTHRRLAPGCFVRLLATPKENFNPGHDYRALCRALEDAGPATHIGLLHLTGRLATRLHIPRNPLLTTTQIGALRLALPAPLARLQQPDSPFFPQSLSDLLIDSSRADPSDECSNLATILDLLRVCRALHTLHFQRWPEHTPPLFDDLRIFGDLLPQFSAVCGTLRTVLSPWGTKFELRDGVWFDAGAFTPHEPDPFAGFESAPSPAASTSPSSTDQDDFAPTNQNVEAGFDCCWATPLDPPWRSSTRLA